MPIGPPNAPLTADRKDGIWVMGGWGTQEPRATFRYSPVNGTWMRGPDLPTPLAWAAAADVGGRLVVAGGAWYSEAHRYFIFSDRTWTLRDR
jgi:hypothetical protein